MSDPSTNIHSPKRPAAAKQLFFDIAQFDKYSSSKDGTSGAATTAAAALPTVSAPRSLTQSPAVGRSINANRRVVNIVYSSFNKQGGGGGAGAAARAGRGGAPTTSGLNVLGEKASVGRAGGAVGRSSLDAVSSKTSKSERFQPSTAHRKLTLPTISPPAAQLLRKAGHQTS